MKTVIFKTNEDKWVETNASACDLCVVEEQLYHQTGKSLWKGDFNVSIVGIRTPRLNNKVSDKFQDIIYFTWTEELNGSESRLWYELTATTLAGRRMHNKPINSKGTAQLKCGFHPSLWKRGKHKGKNALIQIGNEVTVLRDNDGDLEHNFDGEEHTGYFGINLHTANKAGTSTVVGGWSAGCQVTNIPQAAFNKLLNQLKKCEEKTGYLSYSYFLLNLGQ